LEFDILNRTATIWDGGNKSFSLTKEKQLGQAVISILEHPRDTSNQYLYVPSVETTQKEIVAALEKASGARWTIYETTTEEQFSAAIEKLSAGDFSGAFTLVRATCFGNTPGLRANYVQEQKLANDVLGLEMESVENTVRRVVQYPTSALPEGNQVKDYLP
jgi:Na+-translocating ferredoxin:NAD+ oxidoreductase RnfG subunit